MTPYGHCPRSSRTLKLLAKAGSSRKSHVHCATTRGLRVDHRLAGEITCGTSRIITFYKVFTTTAGRGETSRFIRFLSILPICCLLFSRAQCRTCDVWNACICWKLNWQCVLGPPDTCTQGAALPCVPRTVARAEIQWVFHVRARHPPHPPSS